MDSDIVIERLKTYGRSSFVIFTTSDAVENS